MSSNVYHVSASNLSVTGTDDIFQLRGVSAGTTQVRILEIRLWQENLTSLELNTVQVRRGSSGGTGGSGYTEGAMDGNAPTSVCTAAGLPTGNVGTFDLLLYMGWNILQEFVWLPPPELALTFAAGTSHMVSISLRVAPSAAMTTGVSIFWEERSV